MIRGRADHMHECGEKQRRIGHAGGSCAKALDTPYRLISCEFSYCQDFGAKATAHWPRIE
jgi:hypothetical protein